MTDPAGYINENGLRVRYTACFNPEEQTVTIIRAVYAGVDGPWGTKPAATREDAEAALFAAGFLHTDWETTRLGEHYTGLNPFRS